jgi:hypothetical protein
MSKTINKITIPIHDIKATNDSHVKLKMEINGGVCILPFYWKFSKNATKYMFYGSVIKTTSRICGIQH